jgi:anti-anti-sigma regulatory factor/DNA-directed RNA polymerase subunit RPC12/RpoP
MSISIIMDRSAELARLTLSGSIDEYAAAEFTKVADGLPSTLIFDFGGIVALNSSGVNAWITFYKEIYKSRSIIFENCTPEVIMQINMMPIFRGPAVIHSVYANYVCSDCMHKQRQLFVRGQNLPDSSAELLPPVNCQACGKVTEMDEQPEDFFAWIDS